jgi:hypothetical protein
LPDESNVNGDRAANSPKPRQSAARKESENSISQEAAVDLAAVRARILYGCS